MNSTSSPPFRRVFLAAGVLSVSAVWCFLSQVSFVHIGPWKAFWGPDGVLSLLEEKTIDARLRWRGPIPSPLPLAYVNVDTASIQRIGNFPWDRAIFARTVDALFRHGGVKAVGMDFVFSKAGLPSGGGGEDGSRALGKTIRTHQNIVLAATFGTSGGFPFEFEKGSAPAPLPETPAPPVVGPAWGIVGLIDTVGEDVRWAPFFARLPHHTYLPMSLQLGLIWWGLDASSVRIEPEALVVTEPNGRERGRVPLRMGQLAEPNWFGAWMDPQDHHASLVEVLAFAQAAETGTEEEKRLAENFFKPFRGSIVLIGPVDPLLKDLSVMPLSGPHPVPRVSVHGNFLKSLVGGRFPVRPPVWANVSVILGFGVLASLFAFVPPRWTTPVAFAAAGGVLGYVALVFWIFYARDVVLPMVAPAGSAASCAFLAALVQVASEQRQRQRIQRMFGAYLSPALVERLVESGADPQLGGFDAEITAFFSDVQGFSSFSERLTPQQLVALMNEYLSAMTDILMQEGCYVDKYIGDAIVGIFNAPVPLPSHALRACRATQLLHKRLAALRGKWASEGDKWPPFVSRMQMRIGLNTGFATVGNMGSARRFNYTMMGDSVNLAARCESGAKSYGVYTMVTGETRAAAEAAGEDCVFRFLDRIVVKGRTEPCEVHEIVCLRTDLTPEIEQCIALYHEGLAHYQAGRWAAAEMFFQRSAKLEPNRPERNPESPSTPSRVLWERTVHLAANPPVADWNGVFNMTSK